MLLINAYLIFFLLKISSFNSLMSTLGYDPADNTTDTSTPVGIANVAAEAVLEFRHRDGSNQLGNLMGKLLIVIILGMLRSIPVLK